MNLNVDTWDEFRLGDLFSEIYKAEAHVKGDLETKDVFGENLLRFVSRTEANNGCDCYINSVNISGIEKRNAITIGDTTATCSYQNYEFVCGDHMVICRAQWLNFYTAMFLLTIIKREKNKYSYGRAFKMELIENTVIKLPSLENNTPNWEFIENYIKSLKYRSVTTKNLGHKSFLLETREWKEYLIGDVFEIYNGKFITKDEIEENPGSFIAVQSSEENNACMGKIDRQYCIDKGYTISDEPCLTVARSGSAGFVSFQPNGCVVGDSAKILLLKKSENRNKYIYLFLRTVLMTNRYKYNYGRKVTENKYANEVIKLPTKSNEPDWQFMENYIKQLPYSDRI